ncbi:MAG: hypothetical protein H0V01_15225 [Bacteroidetes bacterium]|nr:hypothetical protein [Bacteroidota bacterium]HET6245914.1 hypothetical protein [Bacteroidia bacterium]
MRKYSLVAILLIFISVSCKKQKDSPALLFISPTTNHYDGFISEVLRFDISGSSNTALANFKVTVKEGNSFSQTVFDTTLSTPKYNSSFEYKIPSNAQGSNILLTFILTDDQGNQTKMGKTLSVFLTIKNPEESTGHEMFSALSTKNDAYNLISRTPLYSVSESESNLHLKDDTEQDPSMNYLLGKRWISPAGLKFVRFNEFDYANATYIDLKNAYEAGNKKDFVDFVSNADIILTRFPDSKPDEGYIAIKVVQVIEQGGADFDRYIFNFKK